MTQIRIKIKWILKSTGGIHTALQESLIVKKEKNCVKTMGQHLITIEIRLNFSPRNF